MHYYNTYSPNKEIIIISLVVIFIIILVNINTNINMNMNMNMNSQQEYISSLVSDISDKSAKSVMSVKSVLNNITSQSAQSAQTDTNTINTLNTLITTPVTIAGIFRHNYKPEIGSETMAKIAKLNTHVPKTTATETFYIYIPHKWKANYSWLIKDVVHDKYFIPEGLLKITKGTLYEWLPLEHDTTLTYYVYKENQIKQIIN